MKDVRSSCSSSMLRGLWEDDAVHFGIWFDIDDGAAIEGIKPFHAEDVSVAFDEFSDAEGEGIRATGGAAGEYAMYFPCCGWDGFQKVAFRQMCPVEDDEVFVLLNF